MYGQRALGGDRFALNRRKGMEKRIAENPEHWLADKSNAFKNTYAGVLGVAYTGGTAIAGHYAMEGITGWFGHVFGHHTATIMPTNHAPSVHAGHSNLQSQDTGVLAMPEAPTMPEVSIAPEMPHISVDAQVGHGYEFMTKRI